MCRNFSFSIFFLWIPEKQKAPQTLDTKGFEALFSWFKLILSEPDYVPSRIRTYDRELRRPVLYPAELWRQFALHQYDVKDNIYYMWNALESQHDLYKKFTHINSSTIPKLPHLTIYAKAESPYSYIGIRRPNYFSKRIESSNSF